MADKVITLEIENERLRQMLWLRHGCPFYALYGDDGEMQCNKCMLDFRRDSVDKIVEKFSSFTPEQIAALHAMSEEKSTLKVGK